MDLSSKECTSKCKVPALHCLWTELDLNREDKCAIDFVYGHLTQISFGSIINGNTCLCEALRSEILPRMCSLIKRAEKLKQALDIKMGEDVGIKVLTTTTDRKLKKADELRICLDAAFVMLLLYRQYAPQMAVRHAEEMLQLYPEFLNIHGDELKCLMTYRNVMNVAMQCICPRFNKNRLLVLVTRIVEGCTKRYVTGSGQTDQTSCRVLIYERESGVTPVPRPKKEDAILEPEATVEGDIDPHENRESPQQTTTKRPLAAILDSSRKKSKLLKSYRTGAKLMISFVINGRNTSEDAEDKESAPQQPTALPEAKLSASPIKPSVTTSICGETPENNTTVVPDIDFFREPFLNLFGEEGPGSPSVKFENLPNSQITEASVDTFAVASHYPAPECRFTVHSQSTSLETLSSQVSTVCGTPTVHSQGSTERRLSAWKFPSDLLAQLNLLRSEIVAELSRTRCRSIRQMDWSGIADESLAIDDPTLLLNLDRFVMEYHTFLVHLSFNVYKVYFLRTSICECFMKATASSFLKELFSGCTVSFCKSADLAGQIGGPFTIRSPVENKFVTRAFVKTHSLGRSKIGTKAASMLFNPAELMAYKLLEFMGIGCKTHFIVGGEDTYIASMDASCTHPFKTFRQCRGHSLLFPESDLWGASIPELASFDICANSIPFENFAQQIMTIDLLERVCCLEGVLDHEEHFGFVFPPGQPPSACVLSLRVRSEGEQLEPRGKAAREDGKPKARVRSLTSLIEYIVNHRCAQGRVVTAWNVISSSAFLNIESSVDLAFEHVRQLIASNTDLLTCNGGDVDILVASLSAYRKAVLSNWRLLEHQVGELVQHCYLEILM
jgi:hypothetical protein